MYKIKIILDLETLNYTEKNIKKKEIIFSCMNSMTFSELYSKIDSFINCVEQTSRFIYVYIWDKKVTPYNHFNVRRFLKINCKGNNVLHVSIIYVGLGGADYLSDTLKLEIRTNEHRHINRPHVHISNDKGRTTCSISLLDLKVLRGKTYWNEKFNRKEKNAILELLRNNQNSFINYYITAQKGYYPDPVFFEYNGNRHCID